MKNDFCNPPQMVRDERKMSLRTEFYRRFLKDCDIHVINTVPPAKETQNLIRKVLGTE